MEWCDAQAVNEPIDLRGESRAGCQYAEGDSQPTTVNAAVQAGRPWRSNGRRSGTRYRAVAISLFAAPRQNAR